MRFVPASVLSFSFAIGLVACGPQVADRNIDALNQMYDAAERGGKALSIKEVEAVLGQPRKAEPFPMEMQTTKELQGVRYYYTQDGKEIVLHFVDNKLIRRVERFDEKPIEDAERRKMPPQPAK